MRRRAPAIRHLKWLSARAVLDYLSGAGLPRSCEALRDELGLADYVPDASKQLLERKWLGVIRASSAPSRSS